MSSGKYLTRGNKGLIGEKRYKIWGEIDISNMKSKETIKTLVEKGNESFRYGRTSETVSYFARALMEAGALKIVGHYVIKYRDDRWIKLRMLDELLKK